VVFCGEVGDEVQHGRAPMIEAEKKMSRAF